MKIYGKIHSIMKRERIISIVINARLEYFHMTNRNMKDFKNYLYKKPYVFLEVSDEYQIYNGFRCKEIVHFIKIVLPSKKKVDVFYDMSIIQQGVRSLINKEQYRLFIDLEFSLVSPLTYGVSEIIQYGIVLENPNGEKILEESSLVRPNRKTSLNVKTLMFLSLGLEDFDNACGYIEFYQLLQSIIEQYDPKIIAWGKNDIIAMEQSFKFNHLQALDIRNRYINLMQVIKNYYNEKKEIGLFSTYQEMSQQKIGSQIHDALEDAQIAREIYHIFKERINKEQK